MLWATARSVREERSKQRHALQDFSLVRVSLVKGKGGWRIGSVECLENMFWRCESRETRTALIAVVKLLRRLLHGEEVVPGMYKEVREVLRHLPHLPTEAVPILVDIFTLRTLHLLGYIPKDERYDTWLAEINWQSTLEPLPRAASTAITRGLEASHL